MTEWTAACLLDEWANMSLPRTRDMIGHVHARLRECYVLASNKRISSVWKDFTQEPTIHAIVVESISVDEGHRRQGVCRAFINNLVADERFEMVVVEGVANPILADALTRWGWECDPEVMDFYKCK